MPVTSIASSICRSQRPEELPTADLSAIKEGNTRNAAVKELRRVRDVFTTKRLLAGAQLLRAALRRTDSSQESSISPGTASLPG